MRRAKPAARTMAAITETWRRAGCGRGAGPPRPVAAGYCVGPGSSSWPGYRRIPSSICVVERGRPRSRTPLDSDSALRALDRGLDRALGEDAAEVRLVLHGALEIGLHVDAIGGLRGGRLDGRGVEPLARQGRLHALGAYRLRAGAGDADARLRARPALVERDHRSHADDGEARGRVRELQVRGAGALGEHGHADLDEELVLAERRLHQPREPGVHLHRALLLALADELGSERDDGGRHVGGGVAVGQRDADRALVAHGGIADHRGRLRHDETLGLERLRRLHLPVGGHRPDRDHALVLLDTGEARHLAEVDQVLGLREAQLHHRDQAVAAREDLGVVELAEQLQGLPDAGRGVVLERGWVHGRVSSYLFWLAAPAGLAAWIVFHTRSGDSGIVSMWSTPSGRSASMTAFTTAGVAAIVPVSPAPLMPSGLTRVGVTVRSVSYIGSMSAFGSA